MICRLCNEDCFFTFRIETDGGDIQVCKPCLATVVVAGVESKEQFDAAYCAGCIQNVGNVCQQGLTPKGCC